MPALTLLDSILFGYFLLTSGVIIVLAYLLDHRHQALKRQESENQSLNMRLKLIGEQLNILQIRYHSGASQSANDLIIESLPVGIIVLSKSNTIQAINETAQQIVGRTKTDGLGKKFTDVNPLVTENNQAYIYQENPNPQWIFLKNGETKIPLLGGFFPLQDSQPPEVGFYFWDASDIFNKHLSVENRTRELSTQLTLAMQKINVSGILMDRIDLAFVFLNTKGVVIQVSSQAQKFFGYLNAEMVSRHYRDFFVMQNSNDEVDYTPIEKALAGVDTPFPKWTFVSTRNGRKAVSGAALSVTAPDATYVVAYFRNEDKNYSEQTEEKAFFSSAAHDLRAPLTTIRGVTELLETSMPSMSKDQVNEMIKGAKESSIHLIDLVNDLLNVSRIEQKRIEVKKDSFDLSKTIRGVVDLMSLPAREKHLYLKFEMTDTDIPKVVGDESKTIDVLTNLISNGIKYTQNGGVTLTLKHEAGALNTYIADTGIGIAPHNQTLLFRKYQQVGMSRGKPLATSTGLGLYISKKFSELMGGNVELVTSEPEKGSVFKFSLPVRPA